MTYNDSNIRIILLSLQEALPYQEVDTSFIFSDNSDDAVFDSFLINSSFFDFVFTTRASADCRCTRHTLIRHSDFSTPVQRQRFGTLVFIDRRSSAEAICISMSPTFAMNHFIVEVFDEG